jgi:hypothetical protein
MIRLAPTAIPDLEQLDCYAPDSFLPYQRIRWRSNLRQKWARGGIGSKRFQSDKEAYLDALVALKLPEAMASIINYQPVWSDILVERLRSGRGSAIQRQRRGRGLEDFTEALVKEFSAKTGTRRAARLQAPTGRQRNVTSRSRTSNVRASSSKRRVTAQPARRWPILSAIWTRSSTQNDTIRRFCSSPTA